MGYAIEVKGLRKRFPVTKRYRDLLLHPFRSQSLTALDGLDLQVGEGELFVLLGSNGAGKTTLIKVLTTLLLPTEGEAWVNGYEVTRNPGEVRSSVGYCIGSERSFYWRLTGRQNLQFFSTLNNLHPRQARRRIEEVLQLVGLEESANRMLMTYSTGMRQLMGVARALLTNPEILFMDEPTKSLDPPTADRLRRFIKQRLVGHGGKTVFVATHHLGEAEELADRIAIISQGRVKASGSLGELSRGSHGGSLKEIFDRAVR